MEELRGPTAVSQTSKSHLDEHRSRRIRIGVDASGAAVLALVAREADLRQTTARV